MAEGNMVEEEMKKKLIDDEIFGEDWLLELKPEQKLIYLYVKINANHGGIYKLKNKKLDFETGHKNAVKILNKIGCVYKLDDDNYFIPSVIEDTYYKGLKEGCRPHDSAISILSSFNLWDTTNNTYIIPTQNNQLTEDNTGNQITPSTPPVESSVNSSFPNEFLEAYKIYPGSKSKSNDLKRLKLHKDWKEILPLLKPAILLEIKVKSDLKSKGEFCAPWKNFSTWINNSCWEQEFKGYEASNDSNAIDLSILDKEELWQYERYLNLKGQERANQYLQKVRDEKDGVIKFG